MGDKMVQSVRPGDDLQTTHKITGQTCGHPPGIWGISTGEILTPLVRASPSPRLPLPENIRTFQVTVHHRWFIGGIHSTGGQVLIDDTYI